MISQVSSQPADEAAIPGEELLGEPPPSPAGHAPSRASDYGWPFWFNYAANLAMMVAVSLLFRYADFITHRGGTELHLGWIVGLGMVGSLLMRLAQGVGIDNLGARRIWLWSCVGFIASCLGHLVVTRVDGPAIVLLRIAYNTSIAGIFGASISNAARRATPERMAEVIGTLGTSGFLGMMTGSLLGDRLFGRGAITDWHINAMFSLAAALGTLSLGLAWCSTRGDAPPPPRRQPPFWRVVRRFYPGPVLVMGVAMGFGLGMPQTFVRAFAADLNVHGIALFFWVYAPTAFATRLWMRRLPERIGVRNVALIGQAALVLSFLAFIPVRNQWEMCVPAVLIGVAHAMLFPSVVAGGSSFFPDRFRGLGTTLMLASFDLGMLGGAPLAGWVLHVAQDRGWPRYPTMFFVGAVTMAAAGVYYACRTRGQQHPHSPSQSSDDEREPSSKRHPRSKDLAAV